MYTGNFRQTGQSYLLHKLHGPLPRFCSFFSLPTIFSCIYPKQTPRTLHTKRELKLHDINVANQLALKRGKNP